MHQRRSQDCRIIDEEHRRTRLMFSAVLSVSNSRRIEPLSLLSVANKQICLSLGIQRHFRLSEDRAVAREETTAARCGLSSAREGRTKGIYDVHLSSLYLLSFLFPLPYSPSLLSRTITSVLFRALPLFFLVSPRPFSSSVFIIAYLRFSRFTLHFFASILSRVGHRKSYKCILGWRFYEEFERDSSPGGKNWT